MTLQEIFNQLMVGELSQISIGGSEAGEISRANYPRLVPHITLGLTALYKRFTLKEGEVTIRLLPGISKYSIDSNGDTVFVSDPTEEDFADDLLKIERVTDAMGTLAGSMRRV